MNGVLKLDLSNNPISDSGCRALLPPLHFRKLQQLIIPDIGISSRVREAIRERFRAR
jgi:hypothetical protein